MPDDDENKPQSLSLTLKDMYAVQDSSVADIQDLMNKIHGPGWDARFDFVKILITLSGGIFAAILAFSDNVFSDATRLVIDLIISALLLLIGSIGCSLGAIWHRVGIAGFHATYFNQRDDIRSKSSKVDLTKDGAYEQLMGIFSKATKIAVENVGNSDRKSKKFAVASGVTFTLALVLFLIATIVRYAS